MRKFWPFLYYAFIFASFASYGPFLVLYYQELGFTGSQIGLLTGVTPLITLIASPLLTGLADAKRVHRLVMSLGLFFGASTLVLVPFFHAFLPILVLIVLLVICYSPISALADSATMHMLGDQRDQYGRIRLGGTIGFGVAAAIAGGVIEQNGLRSAFWVAAGAMLIALLLSQPLVHDPRHTKDSDQGSMRKLLTNPRWLLFLAAAFAGGVGTSSTNTYLLSFMNELGASETLMGFTLTLGTISELPVLFFGNRLVRRLTPYRLFLLGLVITGGRFLFFGMATSPAWILVLQLLAGLTFGAMWLGGVAYSYACAPTGLSASAQGMFGAMVFGIGAAVGNFSGGLLLTSLGGRGMYLTLGLVILAIVGITAFFQSRLPAEESNQ
jgi:PPP family 3-phenylpropionic acid transporter